MISLNHIDALQALGSPDGEVHSFNFVAAPSRCLVKKTPIPTIAYSINRFPMFLPPPFNCGDLRIVWRGDARTNKASHPLSHRSSHSGVTRSGWEHEGCAWRGFRFGHGQNTLLGWSDPTFWRRAVAKVTQGVAPAQTSLRSRAVNRVKEVRIASCSFIFTTFFTKCSLYSIHPQGLWPIAICECHRGKKTETGGSDPTFLRPSRPKKFCGSLPPSGTAPVPFFFHGD